MGFSFRHTAGFAAIALVLASCGGGSYGPGRGGVAQQSQEIKWGRYQNPPPAKVAGLNSWIEGFKGQARSQGISDATLSFAFRDVVYNPEVVRRSQNQAEFKKSLWEYLENAVSEKRQVNGRAALSQFNSVLSRVEATYGVDKEVVTAVWGMESTYGERRGDLPLIEALSTLSYEGYRGSFFRSQLMAALRVLQAGDIDPGHMTGSWAGAMGHTQFIPTTYLSYAVDFTGDGRRDIWSNDPSDSLASTANYLAKSGWQRGLPAAVEVTLPAGFNTGLAGKGKRRSVAEWQSIGVRQATSRPLPPAGTSTELLIPGGPSGAAFLITRNFHAILRYNNADSYALAVSLLADRIKGYPGLANPWPADHPGLRLEQRKEMQRLLTARGFDTQGVDGNVGSNTIAAIRSYQSSRGLPVTGEPSAALLDQLRRG
ncbi:lytic murein transglycosylase [Paracoccus sp. MBLB3053]|uniref:Lytic murein transglycosylase n=1 Tax=Paracoccus aurantius TaxID=3073814 RepID=A0ABU2HVN9_9RHOB|nr:lytic murein transglycosylase [Paracoccus sp. MBLB3053]MDS9469111.1 lytic murein transglycosylase [Paracoccus sp. MBLB3053]